MAAVFGVVKVKLNGVDYGTMKGSTLMTGGIKKTSQFASGRRRGTSGQPSASVVKLIIIVTPDFDEAAVKNFLGTAEYITDVGLTYSAANAEAMDGGQFTDDGGGYSIDIEGDEAELV